MGEGMEDRDSDIAGTYRASNTGIWPAKADGLLMIVGAALMLFQVALAFSERRRAGVYVVFFVVYALAVSVGSFTRTVITPEGVRIHRWLRWRGLPWDQVASVGDYDRWPYPGRLTVITRAGDRVRLHFPAHRLAEFVAYARAHGAPAASGGEAGQ